MTGAAHEDPAVRAATVEHVCQTCGGNWFTGCDCYASECTCGEVSWWPTA